MPMASPSVLPRSATVGCRIHRSTSAGGTWAPPSAARPPRQQRRDHGVAPEESFGFGLQAILDGLEAQLAAGRARS
jgi:hypothetical protein